MSISAMDCPMYVVPLKLILPLQKKDLLEYCRNKNLDCHPFNDFSDVLSVFKKMVVLIFKIIARQEILF